ncbi:MAG: thiamine diphosphokinase [Acidimicrobiia bacterium]|nr:thiamine diphosphokinase [Acidimicrobiia bacterium]
MNRTVIVITGASPLDRRAVAELPIDAVIIAADGGLDHARAAGLEPGTLVGDLDSISAGGLAWATEHATLVRHPVDKSATDTELAVAHAASLGPSRIILAAGVGDRSDHAVAALGALGAPELAAVEHLEAWWGTDHLWVVHAPRRVELPLGEGTVFSVLAMHGAATGVTVTGARWPLEHHDLAPLVGLGVSNVAADDVVTVAVAGGILTVFVPVVQGVS